MASKADADALKAEEIYVRDTLIPALIQVEHEARTQGELRDIMVVKKENNTDSEVPLEEYADETLFRYAQLIASYDDRAEKWKTVINAMAEDDPFTAGASAANAIMRIKEFAEDKAVTQFTLDLSEALRNRQVYAHAMDTGFCAWLVAGDEATKARAREVGAANLKAWESHQALEGFPNNAPEACREWLQEVFSLAPAVRPLLQDLKPEMFPVAQPPSPTAAPLLKL